MEMHVSRAIRQKQRSSLYRSLLPSDSLIQGQAVSIASENLLVMLWPYPTQHKPEALLAHFGRSWRMRPVVEDGVEGRRESPLLTFPLGLDAAVAENLRRALQRWLEKMMSARSSRTWTAPRAFGTDMARRKGPAILARCSDVTAAMGSGHSDITALIAAAGLHNARRLRSFITGRTAQEPSSKPGPRIEKELQNLRCTVPIKRREERADAVCSP